MGNGSLHVSTSTIVKMSSGGQLCIRPIINPSLVSNESLIQRVLSLLMQVGKALASAGWPHPIILGRDRGDEAHIDRVVEQAGAVGLRSDQRHRQSARLNRLRTFVPCAKII